MIITDPLFWLVTIPAVVMTGISKGGVAAGLGTVAVPVMALVIPPIQAASIMLPILVVMDVVAVVSYRRTWDGWNLRLLMPAATGGILIGWATATLVSDDGLRLIVGLTAVAFVAWQTFKREALPEVRPPRWIGVLLGAIGGFTSFYANAGGPPVQMFLLPQRMPKELLAGTFVILFAYVNAAKILPFALLGQLGTTNLATSAVLFPLAALSAFAGVKLTRVLPERPFYVVAYVTMVIVGAWLTYSGLRGLLGF